MVHGGVSFHDGHAACAEDKDEGSHHVAGDGTPNNATGVVTANHVAPHHIQGPARK